MSPARPAVATMISVNLPVADVARATAFYEALGFAKDEAFSGATATTITLSDTIQVMLMARDFYASFTPKTIIDAKTSSGALYAVAFDSREAVDAVSAAALAAGGRELHGAEDEGFMYSRAFEDLDGHGFGPFWMDRGAAIAAMSAPEQVPA
jgi:predicted lactoylglutathione lyase